MWIGGPPVLTVDAHNSLPLPYWRTDGLLVVQGGVGAVTVRVDSDLPPFAVPLPPSAPAYVIPTARSDRFFTLAAEVVRSVDADSGVVLDRIPDPQGGVRVVVTADELAELVRRGYEVRVFRTVPIAPLDPSLIESDEDARRWLDERVAGIPREEEG